MFFALLVGSAPFVRIESAHAKTLYEMAHKDPIWRDGGDCALNDWKCIIVHVEVVKRQEEHLECIIKPTFTGTPQNKELEQMAILIGKFLGAIWMDAFDAVTAARGDLKDPIAIWLPPLVTTLIGIGMKLKNDTKFWEVRLVDPSFWQMVADGKYVVFTPQTCNCIPNFKLSPPTKANE